MKAKDIKEYIIENHCMGNDLTIDGVDYNDLSTDDVMEFINDMLTNDTDADTMRKEVMTDLLHNLQFHQSVSEEYWCDQCCHYGGEFKYIKQ